MDLTIEQIYRERQLAETVLLRWRRKYEERGEVVFTLRDVVAGSVSAEQHAQARWASVSQNGAR